MYTSVLCIAGCKRTMAYSADTDTSTDMGHHHTHDYTLYYMSSISVLTPCCN